MTGLVMKLSLRRSSKVRRFADGWPGCVLGPAEQQLAGDELEVERALARVGVDGEGDVCVCGGLREDVAGSCAVEVHARARRWWAGVEFVCGR